MTCIKIGQSGVTYPTATDREWRRGKSKHSGFPTFYILHFRRIGRLFPIRDPVISRRRSGIIDFLGTHWVLPRIFENFAFNIFLCPSSSAQTWMTCFHLLSFEKQHLRSLFLTKTSEGLSFSVRFPICLSCLPSDLFSVSSSGEIFDLEIFQAKLPTIRWQIIELRTDDEMLALMDWDRWVIQHAENVQYYASMITPLVYKDNQGILKKTLWYNIILPLNISFSYRSDKFLHIFSY